MITISYTGMILLFCLLLAVETGIILWALWKIHKSILNAKEQSMVDARAIASLIPKQEKS